MSGPREFTIVVRVEDPAQFDSSAAEVIYSVADAVKAQMIRTATDFDSIEVDEQVTVMGTPHVVEISRVE